MATCKECDGQITDGLCERCVCDLTAERDRLRTALEQYHHCETWLRMACEFYADPRNEDSGANAKRALSKLARLAENATMPRPRTAKDHVIARQRGPCSPPRLVVDDCTIAEINRLGHTALMAQTLFESEARALAEWLLAMYPESDCVQGAKV